MPRRVYENLDGLVEDSVLVVEVRVEQQSQSEASAPSLGVPDNRSAEESKDPPDAPPDLLTRPIWLVSTVEVKRLLAADTSIDVAPGSSLSVRQVTSRRELDADPTLLSPGETYLLYLARAADVYGDFEVTGGYQGVFLKEDESQYRRLWPESDLPETPTLDDVEAAIAHSS